MVPDEQSPVNQFLSLSEVARLLPASPATGRKPSTCSIWRWITKGVNGTRLQSWRVGGRWYTTAQAVETFGAVLSAKSIEKLSNPSPRKPFPKPLAKKPRTAAQRARSLAEAEAVLRDVGCVR